MLVKPLLFIYGSETGTAQDVAETLWQDAKSRKIPSKLFSFDEYDIKDLSEESCVVFVIATARQGELPTSCRIAWRILCHRSLANTLLSGLLIAVLGLGDSSYQRYNFAGKKLFRRLCQLGARPLIDLALADDQHELGVDGAMETFKDDLFQAIFEKRLFEDMVLQADCLSSLPPRYHFIYENQISIPADPVPDKKKEFQLYIVESNERVTALEHFQETRLLKLSVDDATKVSYEPGDVLWVQPRNLTETLDITLKALAYKCSVLDAKFFLEPTDESIRKPSPWLIREPVTLRDCLTYYFDLQMIPRRSFFRKLSMLSSVPMEKEKLEEFGSLQGIDAYFDYCVRPRRTVAESLRDFQETAKSLAPERLFDILCPIRPRAYSIASCSFRHPHIELLVAKVEYRTKMMKELRRGLCSTFMSRLQVGNRFFAKVGTGSFSWPDVRCGLVLVGPGTGVAAFRSILNYKDMNCSGLPYKDLLFFGCRGRTKDFYFNEEWSHLSNVCVITAFSREDTNKKEHVQDKMMQNSEKIWQLINENKGYIYIAGRSGEMPKSVVSALKTIFSLNGKNGEKMIASLEAAGRIQIETWD